MTIDKGNLITLKIRDLHGILQGGNGANNLFTYEDNVTVEQFVKDTSDRFKTPTTQFELVYQDLRRGEIYELSKLPQTEPLTMIHITPSREKEYPFTVEKRKGLASRPQEIEPEVNADKDLKTEEGADTGVENVTIPRYRTTKTQTSVTTDDFVLHGREFVGLKNMTMTCYLNSLIQTLFFTPEFRNAVYMHKATDKTTENKSIALALQKLFLQMQFSVRTSIETDDLTKTFGWRDNEVWMQQDVEELYRLLMDYLSEELKGTPSEGVVPSLFGGLMNDYVECMECHKRNSKEELFLALPLPVRIFGKPLNAPYLEEALKAFITPEILDGNNQYKCEQCQKPCDAKKGLSFKKFPYILTITLNRFEFNWRSLTKHKLNDEIVFPMTLDMTNMLDPETLNSPHDGKRVPLLQPSLFKIDRTEDQSQVHSRPNVDLKQFQKDQQQTEAETESKDQKPADPTPTESQPAPASVESAGQGTAQATEPVKEEEKAPAPTGENTYHLYAVLVHRGGVNGGHYYAFIQDLETGQWYRCDDTTVRRISADEITKTYGGIDLTTDAASEGGVAYILVYRRQDEKFNSKPMTYDLLPPHMKEMWDSMKETDQKCYEREELERNTVKIFVGTRDPGELEIKNIQEMIIQRTSTMKEAAMQCYKEFYPESDIDPDRVRLIRGDKNLNIIENSFEGKDDEIISLAIKRPMPITDAEGFLLDIRNENEEFEVYSQTDIIVFAHLVPLDTDKVQSSVELHVLPSATMNEVREKVLAKLKLTDASVVAVYGSLDSKSAHACPVKLLAPGCDDSMIETLRVTKILNVYVRATQNDAQVKDFMKLASFWVTSFDINVTFLLPDSQQTALNPTADTPAKETSEAPPPNGDPAEKSEEKGYKHQLLMDSISEDKKSRSLKLKVAKTITLKEVSQIISQLVSIDESNFIIYKLHEDVETELLDFQEEFEKLEDCLPFIELRCVSGQRLKVGEGRVNVFLLDLSKPQNPEPNVFTSLIVNADLLGLEVRKMIGDLMEPKLTEVDLPKYLLRRKMPKGPSRVVKDDENLSSVVRKLHGTEFYFQRVEIPDDCAEGFHSIFIRQWDQATNTLSPAQEVFIPQDYTLPAHELVQNRLTETLGLPQEQVQVANPETFGTFPYDLATDVIRDKLHWFSIVTRPRAIYIYNDELFLFTRNKAQVPSGTSVTEPSEDMEEEGVSIKSSKRETGLVINLARSP